MVLLTTTPQILQVLSSLPPSTLSLLSPSTTPGDKNADSKTSTSTSTSSLPLPTSLTSPISHKTLIALSRLRHTTQPPISIPPLNTLLRGTRPYTAPPPPKPAQTPEYIALMARLRQEQEQREYTALLPRRRRSSLSTLLDSGSGAGKDEDTISTSLVLNITLSVVMCAVAMFQMTRWWAGDGIRVLMSLGTGLVVGVAEVGVYSIYLMKVRKAREKERAKRERKFVIGQYLEGAVGVDALGVSGDGKVMEVVGVGAGGMEVGEKEQIWGKGVNGGVRRRVREKWEKEQLEKEEGKKQK